MVTTSVVGTPVIIARYRRIMMIPRCFAATENSELLRSQLDRLHAETESTRAKANSNRLRLLRLSEVVENLRRQAAINVQTGKEILPNRRRSKLRLESKSINL